jgi:hypothetical protein
LNVRNLPLLFKKDYFLRANIVPVFVASRFKHKSKKFMCHKSGQSSVIGRRLRERREALGACAGKSRDGDRA